MSQTATSRLCIVVLLFVCDIEGGATAGQPAGVGVNQTSNDAIAQDYRDYVKAKLNDESIKFVLEKKGQQAVLRWKAGAKVGNPKAQLLYGISRYWGINTMRTEWVAVDWFRRAASSNLPTAHYCLGECYRNGRGVKADAQEAEKWHTLAAESGYIPSYSELGMFSMLRRNDNDAYKWLNAAAMKGHLRANLYIATLYRLGGRKPKGLADAVKIYQELAAKGYAEAQFALASCYWQEIGVPLDKTKSVELWRKAAIQGHGLSQTNLGLIYYYGKGVKPNGQEAIKWFREGLSNLDPKATHFIGKCFEEGIGVPPDRLKARLWKRMAADRGYRIPTVDTGFQSIVGKRKDTLPNSFLELEDRILRRTDARRRAFQRGEK